MAVVVGKGGDEDQPHGGLARAPSSTLEGEGVDGLRRGEGRSLGTPETAAQTNAGQMDRIRAGQEQHENGEKRTTRASKD